MKTILIIALLFLGLQTQAAQKTKVKSKTVSCKELQQTLEENQVLFIQSGFGSNTYVASSNLCAYDEEAHPAYISAADKVFCRVGFVCRESGMYKN